MKAELDKQLCEKYPKIFAQRNLPPGSWVLTLCDEHHNDRSWNIGRE